MDLQTLTEQREEAGARWEAAYQRADLPGMDAAMSRIRALTRQIADATCEGS
jgi:hypothetical protein